MAQLVVDLSDRRSMQLARAAIDAALGELGDAQAPDSAAPRSTASDDQAPPAHATADEYARRLSGSLRTDNTRELIGAFAQFDGPFTLEDVAAALGRDYSTVKAQKFRLGRSEKKLENEFGRKLLLADWRGDRYYYTIEPELRGAIRKEFSRADAD
jgi:hypothetical protein